MFPSNIFKLLRIQSFGILLENLLLHI